PVTQKGREGSILVHAFSNEILSPRDAASGLPTGKRQHKPITILKDVDKASPLLWNALVTNENLITWELKFWTTTAAGVETQIYTVSLTNASIASMKESMADNEDPAKANLPLQEQISFVYQKIEWTWTDGGITAVDDWESPVV
ncbi:MAG: type VI secretion system tube protein TssD, partial [Terracidiphilus sp.]